MYRLHARICFNIDVRTVGADIFLYWTKNGTVQTKIAWYEFGVCFELLFVRSDFSITFKQVLQFTRTIGKCLDPGFANLQAGIGVDIGASCRAHRFFNVYQRLPT